MSVKKKYLCCLSLFLFVGAYAAAQETDVQDTLDAPQSVSVEETKVPQKQEPKKKAQPKAEAPKQKSENKIQSLLPVTGDSFKYNRIPGITLPQTTPMGEVSYIPEEPKGPKEETVSLTENEKPSFFLKAGNDLIKALILLLILAIFILYRVKSKKRLRRKYFKR